MKKLIFSFLILMAPQAFPQGFEVECKGLAVTGEEFALSFCYNPATYQACEGDAAGVKITVNGTTEVGYLPRDIYVHAEGDRFITAMKSLDDGQTRYAELEYTTAHGARWNTLRFRLANADPKSEEELEKTFFQSTDFTCGLK